MLWLTENSQLWIRVLFPVFPSQSCRNEAWLSKESHSLLYINKGKTTSVLGKPSLNHLETHREPMLNVTVYYTTCLLARWLYNSIHGRPIINEQCIRKWNEINIGLLFLYRVSQEECARLRESVPCVKLYRYNPKHLYPKLNGYGDNGHRKVWASGVSTPSVTPYSFTAHARQRDTTS